MEFPFEKALVTGGAGFIGSHVVEELVKMGIDTISVDNYFAGKHENLEHLKDYPNFHEVECDITDRDELAKHFPGVEAVFHQAASKKTICLNDPPRDLAINAEGAFHLLELSRDHGVKKFVHISTGSVYGEAQYYPQDEKHPLVPTSYYGVSKLAGERYAKCFNLLYDLDTTVLRYFHVYGPRQESSDVGGVVSIFTRRLIEGKPLTIFGDGTQQRSFTWVKDVVKANLLAATTPAAKGEIYNCASGITVTIQKLAEMVADILGVRDPQINYEDWQVGDIKVFNIDNSKIRGELGLDFLTDFRKGLEMTVEWARDYFTKKRA
ncbi:MAG: SDR family NAD(P)-dependent oxidoreductase [Candidatus Latescibacterota bacterium]|nr:MAG: SDR family NAD(P)-dependent oxidoreductase [Candidatus Latescibacterota bacterium]